MAPPLDELPNKRPLAPRSSRPAPRNPAPLTDVANERPLPRAPPHRRPRPRRPALGGPCTPGALPWPRLRHPRGARCRPLRRSLLRPPGASLLPRRGDSRSGRRRLKRPLPLLLLVLLLLPPPPPLLLPPPTPTPSRLLRLSAPRNRPPRAAHGPAAPAGQAGSGGPGKRRRQLALVAPRPAPRSGSGEPPALCLLGRGRGGRPRPGSDPPAGPPARRPGWDQASSPGWAAPASCRSPPAPQITLQASSPSPGGRFHRCLSHPLASLISPRRVGCHRVSALQVPRPLVSFLT